MKRFLALLLALLMCANIVALAACKKNNGGTTETTPDSTSGGSTGSIDSTNTTPITPNETTTDTGTMEPNLIFEEIKIGGVPLSDYTIVYSNDDYLYTDPANVPYLAGTASGDFYKQCADRLAVLLKESGSLSSSLAVMPYPQTAAHEIIIGPTPSSSLTANVSKGPTEAAKDDITNYTIEYDYKVINSNSAFVFGGGDNGFVMWQIQTNGTLNMVAWGSVPAGAHQDGRGGDAPGALKNTTVALPQGSASGWYTVRIVVRNDNGNYVADTYIAPQGQALPTTPNDAGFSLTNAFSKKVWTLGKIGLRQDNTESAQYDNIKIYDDTQSHKLVYSEDFSTTAPKLFSKTTPSCPPYSTGTPSFSGGVMSSQGAWFLTNNRVVDADKEAAAPTAPDLENYTIQFDYEIENVCAGFQFSGNDEGYVMWQLVSYNGRNYFNPHIWTSGGMAYAGQHMIDIPNSIVPSGQKAAGWFTVKIVVRHVGENYLISTYLAKRGETLQLIDENFNITPCSFKKDWSLGKIGWRQTASDGNPEIANYDNLKIWNDTPAAPVVVFESDFSSKPAMFETSQMMGLGGGGGVSRIVDGYLHVTSGSWALSNLRVIDPPPAPAPAPALGLEDYIIAVEGGRLIISGGTYGSTWHAIDYFEQYLRAQKVAGKNSLDLTGELAKGKHKLIMYGCVGDSITDGYGSSFFTNGGAFPGTNIMSYPAILQRMLWKDYVVYNFGKGGTTMRDDATSPYRNSYEYEMFTQKMAELDIITILLGTNDAQQVGDWGTASVNRFIADYSAFLDMVETANGEKTAHIVVMNCLAYYGGGNHARPEVQNAIRQVATNYENKAGYDVTFFDMYAFTADTVNFGPDYFPDQLHPGDAGYIKMSVRIAELIAEYQK